MSATPGGEGLFAALLRLVTTLLTIARTRLELLGVEAQEEKNRLLGGIGLAAAAFVLLGFSLIFAVIFLAIAFWEQKLLVFGLFTGLFLSVGLLLLTRALALFRQPSRLFAASLAELDQDVALLRQKLEQHDQPD
ncbi:MAG: hypothetical protein RIR00_325 [Pseudomonadota bacterium]|jgi:uncharacterized membrane protein YqjE